MTNLRPTVYVLAFQWGGLRCEVPQRASGRLKGADQEVPHESGHSGGSPDTGRAG